MARFKELNVQVKKKKDSTDGGIENGENTNGENTNVENTNDEMF